MYWISLDSMAGWDYYVYSGAIQSFNHQQNPYILENINQYIAGNTGGVLPFTYPPHTLYFFWVLNIFLVFENIGIYYALLVVLLIASGYIIATIDQKPQYLFLITLFVTGFMGMVWNLGTGNKDIFFLFLFAVIFLLLVKEQYWQSSIVMGLTAAISLITAPFVALFLVVRQPLLNRLGLILLSGGVVAVLAILSYCVNPVYFMSYLDTITGGNSSPLYDIGGYNTPTPFLLFGDLLKGINLNGFFPLAFVSCLYIGLILYAAWYYFQKNQHDMLKVYSFLTIAVFLMLPRVKPYDFIILVIPLYFLFRNSSVRLKCLMFAVITLPTLFWVLNFLLYATDFPFLLGVYTQTYSAFFIFFIVILLDLLKIPSGLPADNRDSS